MRLLLRPSQRHKDYLSLSTQNPVDRTKKPERSHDRISPAAGAPSLPSPE